MKDRTKFFEAIEEAKKLDLKYIGTGNPDAHILIIAKEPSFEKSDAQRMYEFENNIEFWERDKEKSLWDIPVREPNFYSPLCPFKGQLQKLDDGKNHGTSRTWLNYQKLHNYIFNYLDENYGRINFHKNFFTTELNSSPSPKNKDADTSSIVDRKKFIANSKFFQSFPVVILDGVGYFEISENRNEIEEMFGVKFIENIGENEKQPIWIHEDEGNKKIVINTYQMSINVSEDRLKRMGETIQLFLRLKISLKGLIEPSISHEERFLKGGKEIQEKMVDENFVNSDEYKDYMTWI